MALDTQSDVSFASESGVVYRQTRLATHPASAFDCGDVFAFARDYHEPAYHHCLRLAQSASQRPQALARQARQAQMWLDARHLGRQRLH